MEEIDGLRQLLLDLPKKLIAVAYFGGQEEDVFTGREGFVKEAQVELHPFMSPFEEDDSRRMKVLLKGWSRLF